MDKQYGQSVDGNCEIAVRLFEYHINDHSQDGAYALQINQLYSALQNASWDISKVSDKVWQDMVDVLQQSPAYAKCTFDKSLFVVGGLVEMIEKYREWLLGKIF